MGRKKSAFIAMILTFVMIVSTCVPTFALNMSETYSNQEESEADLENIAELETGDDAAGLRQDTFEPVVLVNPLYADVVNPEDIEVVQYSEKPAGSSEALVGSSGEEIPTTEEEFAEAYRQAFDEVPSSLFNTKSCQMRRSLMNSAMSILTCLQMWRWKISLSITVILPKAIMGSFSMPVSPMAEDLNPDMNMRQENTI